MLDVADTILLPRDPGHQHNARPPLHRRCAREFVWPRRIRVAEVLLSAGQLLLDRSGIAADPYLTLVGFQRHPELAGMTRYMGDDVQNRDQRPRKRLRFPARIGTDFGFLNKGRTDRADGVVEDRRTLDRLGLSSTPTMTPPRPSRREWPRSAKAEGSHPQGAAVRRHAGHLDAAGRGRRPAAQADARRRPPKNTAEYIQASSASDVTLEAGLDWLSPWATGRDPRPGAYEQFRHYHETFYSPGGSVVGRLLTPTSLDRALDGLLVECGPRRAGASR